MWLTLQNRDFLNFLDAIVSSANREDVAPLWFDLRLLPSGNVKSSV